MRSRDRSASRSIRPAAEWKAPMRLSQRIVCTSSSAVCADHVQELGTAQLVLARAHLGQGDLEQAEGVLAEVDESYALTESISHQARSWMVRGELELLRENESEAARLYREAATALQKTEL